MLSLDFKNIKNYSALLSHLTPSQNLLDSEIISSAQQVLTDLSSGSFGASPPLISLFEVSTKLQQITEIFKKNRKFGSAEEVLISGINLQHEINQAALYRFLELSSEQQEDILNGQQPDLVQNIRLAILRHPHYQVLKGHTGDTLFHLLCRSKNQKCRQLSLLCLETGFNINTPNSLGMTGIHFAAYANDVALTDAFTRRGADLELRATTGHYTAFDFALTRPHLNFALLQLLAPSDTCSSLILSIVKMHKALSEGTFYQQLQVVQEANKLLFALKALNFPSYETIQTVFNLYIEPIRELVKEYDVLRSKIENGHPDRPLTPDWIDYAAHNGMWDIISDYIALNRDYVNPLSKLYYHLFLDKHLIPSHALYEGFDLASSASALVRMMMRLDKSVLTPQEDTLYTSLYLKLVQPLKELVIMEYLQQYPDQLAEKIVQNIKSLQEGEVAIIPCGCKAHSTSLLIERQNNRYDLTVYNTGAGIVKHHPQSSQSSKFQTFMTIKGVSLYDLDSPRNWKMLMYYVHKETDMDNFYQFFNEVLGGSGVKELPSVHIEAYESKQITGTCATQTLTSLLRHQSMQIALNASLSPEEQKAFYKKIKLQLLETFHQDNQGDIETPLKKNLPKRLLKHDLEKKLIEIAEDESLFLEAWQGFIKVFELLGSVDEIINDFTPPKSPLSRFGLLRSLSCRLAIQLEGNGDPRFHKVLEDKNYFSYTKARLAYRQKTIKNIKARFQALSLEAPAQELSLLIVRAYFLNQKDLAVDMALTPIHADSKEIPEWLDHALNILSKMRFCTFKSALVSKLHEKGFPLLATEIYSI